MVAVSGNLGRMEEIHISTCVMDREGNVRKASHEEAEAMLADEEACQVGYFQDGETIVSTAFLPFSIPYEPGPPQCFETVVVRGMRKKTVRRYHTFDEAARGHEEVVKGL